MPIVAHVPRGPIVNHAPRRPMDVLAPILLKLILMPGSTLKLRRKRKKPMCKS